MAKIVYDQAKNEKETKHDYSCMNTMLHHDFYAYDSNNMINPTLLFQILKQKEGKLTLMTYLITQ